MSQSTPICYLFCSECKREDANHPNHYDRDHVRNYLDVIVTAPARGGKAAICKAFAHSEGVSGLLQRRRMS